MARAALFLVAALIAQSSPGDKKESKPVAINIYVIEADKKSSDFDDKLKDLKNAMPGYSGAKILDELNTKVEEGSSVSLEIMRRSGEARLMKVTVLDVDNQGTVKLHIAIDELKFSSDTTHKKGARLVVGKALSDTKALFLAVKPNAG